MRVIGAPCGVSNPCEIRLTDWVELTKKVIGDNPFLSACVEREQVCPAPLQ
jgi:hypothetical protein